jgi:hypothetical protein
VADWQAAPTAARGGRHGAITAGTGMNGVSVDAHVAGRGAGHALPPGELEVPVSVNALGGPFLGRWVDPFYLSDPARLDAAQSAAWCAAARACDDAVLEALLTEADWRPRMVGAWFVAVRGADGFEPRLGRLLLRSDVCFAGRAYAVALASLATPGAAGWLERYLAHYLARPELDYDQAEVLAALLQLDATRGAALLPAWKAYVGGRRDTLSTGAVPQVRAQLEALSQLRERVAALPEPAPAAAPAVRVERRSQSLAARLQRALERFGSALRRR